MSKPKFKAGDVVFLRDGDEYAILIQIMGCFEFPGMTEPHYAVHLGDDWAAKHYLVPTNYYDTNFIKIGEM